MSSNPYGIHFPWRNVLATVALAIVMWGVPFVIWPQAIRVQKAGAARAPMRVRFLGEVQGVDGSAWSPVVFPLPTKYGFSERVDASGMGHDLAQVFQPMVTEGVFLPVPLPLTPPADVGMLGSAPGGESFRPSAVGAKVFDSGESDAREPWSLEMDGILRERQFSVKGLMTIIPDAGSRGVVEAYVELDRSGAPMHVLLDRSSGNTNLDGLIVRALYAGRSQRGPDGDGGRVRLSYQGVEGGGEERVMK